MLNPTLTPESTMTLPPADIQRPNTEVTQTQTVRDASGITSQTPYTAMVKLIWESGMLTVSCAVFICGFAWLVSDVVSQNRQMVMDRKEADKRLEEGRKEESFRIATTLEKTTERQEKQRDHDELRTQAWFKVIQDRSSEEHAKTRAVLEKSAEKSEKLFADLIRVHEDTKRVLERIASAKGMP